MKTSRYMEGDTVYVRSIQRRGEAVVDRVSGESIRVRWEDDSTTTHHESIVEHARPPISMVTVLSRPSTTDAELAPVPKPETCRDSAYLAWIRTQPCAWSGVTTVEASHHPREGHGSKGMKCSDRRVLPLAPTVHRQFSDHQRIGSMTPEQTRGWASDEIVEHLSRYIDHLEGK